MQRVFVYFWLERLTFGLNDALLKISIFQVKGLVWIGKPGLNLTVGLNGKAK